MYGTAELKNNIKGISSIKKGDIGFITAYLPKNKIFSIYFKKGMWITFEDWELNKFNKHFKYNIFDTNNIEKK